MITNSKKDFFGQLKYELERIGMQLSDDIRIDFEEHFAECKDEGVSESEAAERLGDVKEIARNYLNLESSRINSMVARDIERRVSLTKPGRDVPADLSLLKDKQENEYEHIIEYTPEHFSEEIYPQAENSQRQNSFTYNSSADSQNNSANNSSANASDNSQGSAGSDKNVADAFSNAGRAVADAAKVTGGAIADAFGQSGVKKAVANAGKTTADAVKTAGHSAAEAVKNASHNVADKVKSIPRPSDKIREHTNNDRRGTIPNNPNNKSAKKGYHFIDAKGLKPNVNYGKLIRVILLDVLLWSWLLPTVIGIVIGVFLGGFQFIAAVGIPVITRQGYYGYYHVMNAFFWGIANISLGFIISLIGICLVSPVIKLFKFIVNQHIKAIYDL